MAATILDGKAMAAAIKEELRERVSDAVLQEHVVRQRHVVHVIERGPVGEDVEQGEVVRREDAGDLVAAQRLEMPGGSQVELLAILPGERVVGHFADERLDE